ncbi:MAG: DUF697 domain-containing protein [Desulfobacterales bacterium]|nr:DUF697 domain-containing protein [Desulfobacterales bacterium]
MEEIERKKRADIIIIDNMLWSGLGGIIPLPFIDIASVAIIQLKMINELCCEYKIDFSENIKKSIIISTITGVMTDFLGKSTFRLISSMFGVFGTTAESLTTGFWGAAATYAIGKVFVKHFESGGTLINFNFFEYKDYYKEKLKEAKNYG